MYTKRGLYSLKVWDVKRGEGILRDGGVGKAEVAFLGISNFIGFAP